MPPLSLSSILLHDLELAKVFQKENAWHHQPIAEGPLPQKYQPIHYLLLLHLSVFFEAFFFFFFCMFDSSSCRQNIGLQQTTVFYPKEVESDLSALQI